MKRAITTLERVTIVLASLALSFVLIALLSGYFAGRDQAGISGGSAAGLGERFPDLGHAHLNPGLLRPEYSSDPPTSGAHIPLAVLRQDVTLDDNQLLQALELGDVVIDYGTPSPTPALRALQAAVAGPFTPQLAAAGQAIILARRAGTSGLLALAWTRLLHVPGAGDPQLRAFAEQWLGRGAPGH